MKNRFKSVPIRTLAVRTLAIGLAAAAALPATPASARHRHHWAAGVSSAAAAAASTDAPQGGSVGRGPYAAAGGIYSPDYQVPGGDVYHLGGQILGGDFGKAYEDYYRHYYYYKYAYCPLGSSYVIYLRRCVSPFDLLK